ncbi:hypothetical protein HanXRQr2_Chr16g0724051 [Helianthus annuus]|uniref:Uncharacterized protein n=1 Tax=Helianthus annuus TaxID=4232 RepID=A0A9K3GWZ0_HELAN|nr:hypothetical protein HanXRQr2_Chr16g0724051 [Helianthus annuus]KAJ0819293.1 hypothetical protein HanPSC8_Chr16g0694441 [Helianthus annuus]
MSMLIFRTHCHRQMILRTIYRSFDQDLLCMGINTHAVCTFGELEKLCWKTHTHTF